MRKNVLKLSINLAVLFSILIMLCSCNEETLMQVDNARCGFIASDGQHIYYLKNGNIYIRYDSGKSENTHIEGVEYIGVSSGKLYYITRSVTERSNYVLDTYLNIYNPQDKSSKQVFSFKSYLTDDFYISGNYLCYTQMGKLSVLNLSDYTAKEILNYSIGVFCVKDNIIYYLKSSDDEIESFEDVIEMKNDIYAYDIVSDSHMLLIEELDNVKDIVCMNEGLVICLYRKGLYYYKDGQECVYLSDDLPDILFADNHNNIYYYDMSKKCVYKQNITTAKKIVVIKDVDNFGGIVDNEIYVGNDEWRSMS